MEYKEMYSLEEIQELVNWFKNKQLPQSLQIDSATSCSDLKETVEALSEQAMLHYKNPTFNYAIRLLYQIKEKIED